MKIVHTKSELREILGKIRAGGRTIGLVPTMGALHAGHMSLISRAALETDFVVVTIFVNPLQFGANEDLDKYPRRLEEDAKLCNSHGAHLVFAPTPDEMYPTPTQTLIYHTGLDDAFCGAYRPGHFRGVLTVVAKLFNLVDATRAFFGSKDYQQLHLIRRMVQDLDMSVQVVACPTVREADGLAMSSRNEYLSPVERQNGLGISRGLIAAKTAFDRGERNALQLRALVEHEIVGAGADSVQYIEVLDRESLTAVETLGDQGVILVAAYYGSTRLIDNIEL